LNEDIDNSEHEMYEYSLYLASIIVCIFMKKVIGIALKQVDRLVECTLSLSVNTTSSWISHQPKVSESVKKFKKK
jgi:cyclic lactone autoinducer peptide